MIAAEVAGEEAGLDLREKAVGDGLVDERVEEGVLFPLLPCGEDFFAGVRFEENGSAFLNFEIIGADLLAVDEGKGKTVREEGAELLHEVECERMTAGPGLVKEAGLGIEADGFAGGAAVVGEEDVEEGEQGVGAVERRAFASALEQKCGISGSDEVVEAGEVGCGGFAFDAAKGVEVGGADGGADAGGEEIGGAGEGVGAFGAFGAVVPRRAQEDGARIVEFGGDHVLRDRQGGGFGISTSILLAAEEDVSGHPAIGAGNEFPMRGEKADGDAMLVTTGHEAGGDRGIPAEGDDTFQIVEGDAEFAFSFVADLDGGSILAEVCAFQGDVEGVQMLAHVVGSYWLLVIGIQSQAGLEPGGRAAFEAEGFWLAEVDEGAGVAFAGFIFGGGGDAGTLHLMDGGDGGEGEGAEGRIERDFGAAAGFSVEDEGGWDFRAEHFLKADGLGAELDFIGAVGFWFAAFVFDGGEAVRGFQI